MFFCVEKDSCIVFDIAHCLMMYSIVVVSASFLHVLYKHFIHNIHYIVASFTCL